MAGDHGAKVPLESMTASELRKWLEQNRPDLVADDGSDDAVWLLNHLDLAYGLLAVRSQ
jgi:hypothetical protein